MRQYAQAQQLGHLLTFEVKQRPNNTDIVEGTFIFAVPMNVENQYFTFTDDKSNRFIIIDGENIEIVTTNPNERFKIENQNAERNNVYVVISKMETQEVNNRRFELYKQFPHLNTTNKPLLR